MNNDTPIYLTAEETKMFLEFQKHYKFMEMMAKLDAWDIKGGFVTMHFTNGGEIGSIDVQRRYKVIP